MLAGHGCRRFSRDPPALLLYHGARQRGVTIPPVRRLARYTLNTLTALSLVLCVAVTGAWVTSRRVSAEVWRSHAGGWDAVGLRHGAVRVEWFHYDRRLTATPIATLTSTGGPREADPPQAFNVVGFGGGGLDVYTVAGAAHGLLIIPLWIPVAGFGALPAARAVTWWRRRQQRHGRGFPVEPSHSG